MKHASLFSGIGGFDLAADWMGWENVFSCEIEPFPRKILNYYWPDAISYQDIKETDFKKHHGSIDIISGGFPCQPYSTAGKRQGKEDDRHLWPEMLRAIREIKPRYVLGENVLGLVNWNGGLVFEEVQADLENEGYKVQPVILPACAVNAPHRRERVWFVAYSDKRTTRPPRTSGKTKSYRSKNNDEPKSRGEQTEQHIGFSNVQRLDSNPKRKRQQKQRKPERPLHKKKDREWKASWAYDDDRWPTQPPVCSGNDGIPRGLDGITVRKWREESIKGYGNAIVPQLAYEIFKVIHELNQNS